MESGREKERTGPYQTPLVPARFFNPPHWQRAWNRLPNTSSNPPPYRYLDLFTVVPSSTPQPPCVNSQLLSLPPVGIHINSLCSTELKYLLNLFTVSPISSTVRVYYYELTTWPTLSWLDSSVGRVLHRYRKGHEFESRSGLNFFQAFISQLLLCA